jgi:NAD(P)-dependent dehydrogenase (short-subunit alcohol dehydrogenase family)
MSSPCPLLFEGDVNTTLEGRVAVVTGASRGVGGAIAFALAKAQADVVIVARGRPDLEAASRSILEATGRAALSVAADVTSRADVERLRQEAEARFGAATILVNAAAVFGPLEPFSRTDPADWIKTMMVNTVGPYLTCRFFVPGMLAAGWGRIVNLSSAGSLYEPGPLDSAYSTSKAALNRMTRHLAAELEGTGVTATVIHPGSFKTDMWADIKSKVERLGPEGEVFRAWVERVDQGGGDAISLASELVLDLVDPSSPGRNGEFAWPRDGIDTPVASW